MCLSFVNFSFFIFRRRRRRRRRRFSFFFWSLPRTKKANANCTLSKISLNNIGSPKPSISSLPRRREKKTRIEHRC
jgi:hypothetical protein